MGTVKYTGPVASFHCPTNAEIRSLKVHFSPKQEGSGDPSPENVREIVGWDGVEVEQRGKNLFDANNPNIISPNCWVSSNASNKITASNVDRTVYIECLPNTTYIISKTLGNVLAAGYTTELPAINVQTYSYMRDSANTRQVTVTTGTDAKYLAVWCYDASKTFDKTVLPEDIYRTLQIEYGSTATPYEPYQGSTTDYEFGVLGKNKFNWNVPASESSPGSDPSTAREFTLDTYVIGMSVNNYYRQNYANWVLNPSVSNGTISFSSNAASGYGIAFPMKLTVGQTYFLSGTGNGVAGATYYDKDGNVISYQNNRLNNTIIIPENTVTTLIGFYANTKQTDFTFSNIQLELGSTATTYEPYDPNHTVYGGWVDLISGEVCEEWEYGDMGDLNWDTASSAASTYSRTLLYKNAYGDKDIPQLLTDSALVVTISRFNQLIGSSGYYTTINSLGRFYFMSPDIDGMSSAQIKEWMQGKKYCVYNTPTIYQLAPTQLQTFLGQNNVWSNADYVEVEYDLHETQDILARKQFIIANQPHIVKPAAAPLQNFVTDVVAPLKECKVHFSPVQDLHGYDKPWVGGSGKNLFNINSVEQNPDNVAVSNETKRIFNSNTYFVGSSYSNYWNSSKISSYSIEQNSITIDSSGGYGLGFAVAVTEGNYYLSWTINGEGYASVTLYENDGTAIIISNGGNNNSFTVPSGVNIIVITFRNKTNGTSATFSNIQLELGSTATSYEPYENICPISGWTGLEVIQCGKNFSTAATGTEMVQKWPIISSGSSRTLELSGLEPGQEFTLSASFTKASEPSSNKRLYLVGSQKANSTSNTIFYGPSADGPHDAVIHNWVDTDGTIKITHNNRGLTYNDDFIEYAASLQNIQLEVGDTATAFEPYNGTTIPITFPTEAGTVYGGYVDLVTGEVWETYIKITLNTSNTTVRSGGHYGRYMRTSLTGTKTLNDGGYTISNILPEVPSRQFNDLTCGFYYPSNSQINVYWEHPDCETDEGAEALRSNQDIYFVSVLATPTLLTALTPTQLKTLRGTNNIWSSANGDIQVKYWSH